MDMMRFNMKPENIAAKRLGFLSAGFDIIQQNIHSFTLLPVVFHNHTAAPNNLASISILVNLAQTSPFTELLCIINLAKQTKNI